MFLAGTWATLQFKFVPLQYPGLAAAAENGLLVGTAPVTTAYLLPAFLAAGDDAAAVPFYAIAVVVAGAVAFLPPLPPSFDGRRGAGDSGVGGSGGAGAGSGTGAAPKAVQTRGQCALLALWAVLLPPLLYAALHARRLATAEHAWGLALASSVPLVALRLVHRDALWWEPAAAKPAHGVASLVAFCTALAALEVRVIFKAFGPFIKLPAPWSGIVVTTGLFLGGFLVATYFAGLMPAIEPGVIGVACVAAAAALGTAAGLPLHILPFALAAGAGASALCVSAVHAFACHCTVLYL